MCADATLVDLTHDIAAHDVAEAAALTSPRRRRTSRPAPLRGGRRSRGRQRAAGAGGVGRRTLVRRPDNGVLTPVLTPPPSDSSSSRRRAICASAVSRTFEGRDRFAPAAAWLPRGVPLDALGPPVTDSVRLDLPRPQLVERCAARRPDRASIASATSSTSIDRAAFEAFACGAPVAADARRPRRCALVGTYAEIGAGKWRRSSAAPASSRSRPRRRPALGRRDGVARRRRRSRCPST